MLQIFIEPKGEYLMAKDRWKEDFLKSLDELVQDERINFLKVDKYKVVGLPFFNDQSKHRHQFKLEFQQKLRLPRKWHQPSNSSCQPRLLALCKQSNLASRTLFFKLKRSIRSVLKPPDLDCLAPTWCDRRPARKDNQPVLQFDESVWSFAPQAKL